MNKAFANKNVLWIVGTSLALLAIVGFALAAWQQRGKRIELEQALQETERANAGLQVKLGQVQEESEQLKDQARELAKQVEQEKQAQAESLQQLSKQQQRIKALEGNLQDEKQKNLSLANTVVQLEEAQSSLNEQLQAAQAELSSARKSSGRLKSKSKAQKGVELKKIVVKPKARQLNGRVLVVNREFEFLVIDLGRKNGLKIGDEFKVFQGVEEIGKVKVEKVYEAMSTAGILSGSQLFRISEDSAVKSF
ncbi:hypothetical protein ACFL1I_04255 [Candidatus Omnitrophota bacterium]